MGTVASTLDSVGIFLKGWITGPFVKLLANTFPGKLNEDNIQGDVILGLPKMVEQFVFYEITDVSRFRKGLSSLVPKITTMSQVTSDRNQIKEVVGAKKATGGSPPLIPISGTNIGFSQFGLNKLGKSGDLADDAFKRGQKADINALGDPRSPSDSNDPDWLPQFKEKIDMIILITGDTPERITERVNEINQMFSIGTQNASLRQIFTHNGSVRPGDMKAREHFGYLDGISQPGIKNYSTLNPGQEAVPSGIALCRNSGDPRHHKRPDWSKDGSFLVFRYLEQLVPEFDDFLIKNPIVLDGLPRDEGSALLGARMVGRWKSGAPVDIAPLKDDPDLGPDASRNNNFDFSTDHSQDRCPFAAHIRKTNPRSDEGGLLGGTTRQRIWRHGIPFGPEVTPEERQQAKTIHRRGLAFVCYQSSIDNGFHFIQEAWCNNVNFPIKLLPPVTSGYDPIVGQNGNKPRNMFDPKAQGKDLKLPFDFVVPKGGEYFFAPSISTLRELAVKA